MLEEYREYKRIKAKLRLLEVLISKQDSSKSIWGSPLSSSLPLPPERTIANSTQPDPGWSHDSHPAVLHSRHISSARGGAVVRVGHQRAPPWRGKPVRATAESQFEASTVFETGRGCSTASHLETQTTFATRPQRFTSSSDFSPWEPFSSFSSAVGCFHSSSSSFTPRLHFIFYRTQIFKWVHRFLNMFALLCECARAPVCEKRKRKTEVCVPSTWEKFFHSTQLREWRTVGLCILRRKRWEAAAAAAAVASAGKFLHLSFASSSPDGSLLFSCEFLRASLSFFLC